jgi:hypothetical protein
MPKCIHAAGRRRFAQHMKARQRAAEMRERLFDDELRRATGSWGRKVLSAPPLPPIVDPWEDLSASSPACETGAFRVKVTAGTDNAATIAPGNAAWARVRANLLALWRYGDSLL